MKRSILFVASYLMVIVFPQTPKVTSLHDHTSSVSTAVYFFLLGALMSQKNHERIYLLVFEI